MAKTYLDTHHSLPLHPHNICPHRNLYLNRPHHPRYRPQVQRRTPLLPCTTRNNGFSLDGAFLYPCLRNCGTRMVTCFSGIHSHSYQSWFRDWRDSSRWVAYSKSGELLVVCLSLSHILLPILTIE
jgi:hypothetical protein